MSVTGEMLRVLRHDLHKIHIVGASPHKKSLLNETARKADSTAAWISRNSFKEEFEEEIYRKSLIFRKHGFKKPRYIVSQNRYEVATLFKESNAFKLHEAILSSKLLNLYCEARNFPYTSLKYHILLACALSYNYINGYELKDLYLCENLKPKSAFQIIYKDDITEWTILPHHHDNLSRVHPKFYTTWERRTKPSIGGDVRELNGFLSCIGSWSTALATIEDFFDMIKMLKN